MIEVYLDLLLGLNFAMNYVVLWAAGRLAGLSTRAGLLAAAAGAGALYSLTLVIPVPSLLMSPGFKIVLSLVMILIAYRPPSLVDWAKITGCFYVAALTAGGTALAVSWLIAPADAGPLPLIGAAAGACIALGRTAYNAARAVNWTQMLTADIQITVGSRSVTIRGLIDTGNRLRDPFGSLPVIVLDRTVLIKLSPPEAGLSWLSADGPEFSAPLYWLRRIRAIPYRTLDGRGVMIGLRPDRVEIKEGGRKVVSTAVVLGASPGPVSADGSVRALIPPELVWQSRAQPVGDRLRAIRVGGGEN